MKTCSVLQNVHSYTNIFYEIHLESDATVNAVCLCAVIQIKQMCVSFCGRSTLLELRVGVYEILDYCLDFAVGHVMIGY